MFKRVKQFIAAITAELNSADRAFLEKHLRPAEQKLFRQMNLPEQRHSLNVAYTGEVLAADKPEAGRDMLIRAALLHDIGKVRGDISIADKVFTVIADTACPGMARRLARQGRGTGADNLRHALFVYYHHAERGADMLSACGAEPEIIELVRRHHLPAAPGDAEELTLLRAADNLN